MTTVTIDRYVAGDSLQVDFIVREADGSTPVDLTGATIRWGIAQGKPTDIGDEIIVKSSATVGIVLTDAANGKVAAVLDRGDFVQVGSFVHELEVTLPSGESYTVARGVFRALPAVFAE